MEGMKDIYKTEKSLGKNVIFRQGLHIVIFQGVTQLDFKGF
jgi:hypothetical protein